MNPRERLLPLRWSKWWNKGYTTWYIFCNLMGFLDRCYLNTFGTLARLTFGMMFMEDLHTLVHYIWYICLWRIAHELLVHYIWMDVFQVWCAMCMCIWYGEELHGVCAIAAEQGKYVYITSHLKKKIAVIETTAIYPAEKIAVVSNNRYFFPRKNSGCFK